MLLRASGQRAGRDYNLDAALDDFADAGVPHSALIRKLTEATVRNRWNELGELRDVAAAEMDEQQMIDVLIVASAFNGITRVADATGIPLDEATASNTDEMRAAVGINRFNYAEKSERYDIE